MTVRPRWLVILLVGLSCGLALVGTGYGSGGAAQRLGSAEKNRACTWQIGEGEKPGTLRELFAVDGSSSENVWAVGRYWVPPESTTPPTPYIERWDGREWSLIKGPTDVPYAVYGAIRVFGKNDVWVVGSSPDRIHALIAHWNGTNWKTVLRKDDYYLLTIDGRSSRNVWTGGHSQSLASTLIMHWDGQSWRTVANPATQSGNRVLYDIAVTPSGKVWAVGHSYDGFVLQWNGHAWKVIPIKRNDWYDGIAASSDTNVWAVGYGKGAFAGHWNGRSWSKAPSAYFKGDPFPDGAMLNDVSVTSPRDAWAVGATDKAYQGKTVVEHWDGTRWSLTLLDTRPGQLTSVKALAPTDVWAVGSTDGTDNSLIAHYSC